MVLRQVVLVTCVVVVQAVTRPGRPTVTANDILARYPGQDDYISPTRVVWAVVGQSVDLLCNLTSPLINDPALLVLWYKQGVTKPIYSYDMRVHPPKPWQNPTHFPERLVFDGRSDVLALEEVQTRDGGTYTCRVDFRTNPTLTYTTNLTVIVPPRRLSVHTELGIEVRQVVGPYLEGEDLRLTCRANGGSPPPRVTWWEGSLLLDMTPEVESLEQVSNTMVLEELARRDLGRKLTCHALNSNLTKPLTTTLTLDMNFPPLWVSLERPVESLSAGVTYDIPCRSAGGRPPPNFSWTLDGHALITHEEQVSQEGNLTISQLRWTPSVSDAGKVLVCVVESPTIDVPRLTDDWKLNILYKPMTVLKPGKSLNLSNIEEGDDVYFECSIQSNPWVYKITWLHETHELQHNVSAGVIISNQSLVLQRVTRAASGNYYCVASNVEGDGRSNPILLKVKYSPVCRHEQMTYHGAARYEQVNIPCELDAFPPPHDFTWTFNNSGESVEIPKNKIYVHGSRSTVSYTPNTELDYGTLLCWGVNSVGLQRHPCVFHVFPAGRPDPVHNCSGYNLSETVVNVRCVAGFDGGLPQTFVLELYDPHTDTLVANTTASVPQFTLGGLAPGLTYTGVVFSTNGKGRSEHLTLATYTLKDVAERRTGETAAVKPPPRAEDRDGGEVLDAGGIIAVALGAAGGLLLVSVLICLVVRVRLARRRRGGAGGGGGGDKRSSEGSMGDSLVILGTTKATSSSAITTTTTTAPSSAASTTASIATKDFLPPPPLVPDEKNPDLIPMSDADWNMEVVNTISASSMPSAYVTLPRGGRACTHQGAYQHPCGGVDVQYAELLLTGAVATPGHHHRGRHVVYAPPLDPKHFPPPPPPAPHPQHYPRSANTTPTHVLHPRPPPDDHVHHHPHPTPQQCPWTTLPRRHSLRRDPSPRDDLAVPPRPQQKESSV